MTSNFDLILDVNISDNATRDGDISGIDIDLDQAPLANEKGGVDHDAAFDSVFAHKLFTISDFILNSNCPTDDGLEPTLIVAYFHLVQGIN